MNNSKHSAAQSNMTFMPIVVGGSGTEETLLDTFDFDVALLPNNIVDYDNHRIQCTTPIANSGHGNIITPEPYTSPIMMGDYSEKEHFIASSSIIRNEVLEMYHVSSDDVGNCVSTDKNVNASCIAYRCIHCKHIPPIQRAAMAEICPKNLLQIQDTFINFRELHVRKCPFIPTDIRQSYVSFRAQEEPETTIDDQFPWVSSAVSKGLRKDGRGLVHCPEQAIVKDVISDLQSCLEFAKHRQANTTISVSSYDILTSHLSDSDVVFKIGWNGLSSTDGTLTGNNNWQQLMRDLKTIYHCTISQAEKSNIICLIVNVCRNQNPPGRFLLQDDTSGRWNEIGDDEAENRTKLALYELSNDEYAVKDTSSSSATSASPVKVKEILRHAEDMVRETEAMELLDLLKDENDDSIRLTPRKKKQKLESKENEPLQVKREKPSPRRSSRKTQQASQQYVPQMHTKTYKPQTPSSFVEKPRRYPKNGDQIYAAWWPEGDLDRSTTPSWHQGIVKSSKTVKGRKVYSVSFDDGDALDKIQEHQIMIKEVYIERMTERDSDIKAYKALVSEMLCDLPEGTKLKKKAIGASSSFIGVSKCRRVSTEDKFDAKCNGLYLGAYTLEVDAALAISVCHGIEKEYEKVNFATVQDYLVARQAELNTRCLKIDTKDALLQLYRVKDYVSNMAYTSEDIDDEYKALVSELLSDLPDGTILTKKTKIGASSSYHGVSKNKNSVKKFEVRFRTHYLSSYTLEADAALVYDCSIRALGSENDSSKVNFATAQDYMKARKKELKIRCITIDPDDAVAELSRVKEAVSKAVSKFANTNIEDEDSQIKALVSVANTNIEDEDSQIKALVSDFFMGDLPKDTVFMKKTISGATSSAFHGVSKKHNERKFLARFRHHYLTSYILEVDAALSFDWAVRAHGMETYYPKINFGTMQDYMKARKKELKMRCITIDPKDAVAELSRVKEVVDSVKKCCDGIV